MDKYTRLIRNSGIFAISSLGSHLVSFVLVRFYTEMLTTTQYGLIDFMVTTISVVVPVISLSVVEAVLRFGMDNDCSSDILSNGVFVALCGTLLFCFIGSRFLADTAYEKYGPYMVALVALTSIDNICAQYIRGRGRVASFAISGIVKTIVFTGSNIVLLLYLRLKVEGYLLSLIISEAITILFLMNSIRDIGMARARINAKLLSQMLKYSIPLIPNSLFWWVMNAADKYVILGVLGAGANGLYAVAHKIPSLVNICNSLFFQAWQLSAVEEERSKDRKEFYSNVFNALAVTLFLVAGVLLVLIKPVMSIMVSDNYANAWKYIPYLVIAMVFSAFSGFLGTNYVASKKTKGALKTTLFGAGVNILLNIALINRFGMNGAAFATMVSFCITWLYRAYDTKEYVHISYNTEALVLSTVALVLQSILMINEIPVSKYTGILACVLIVVLYRIELKMIWQKGKNSLVRKTRNA